MMPRKVSKQEQFDRAVKWWNERVDTVIQPDIGNDHFVMFKWNQLVWQEVIMFIKLGKVEDGELDWLIKRRGFNKVQAKFLREILEHIGLLDR